MNREPPDIASWSCPLPLRDHDRVQLAHGGGGRLSAELTEHLFLPAFGAPSGVELHDAATVAIGGQGGRLAFTTDSYVVRPLFFPGGCIGDLAVHGTVNDLAMAGAVPLALSAAFIIEEGLELATLGEVAERMGRAARAAGIAIVTGDTKVVDSGHADGLYVTTSGIGLIPDGVDIHPTRATPGDRIIVSGPIGLHGIAVLSRREGLEFGTSIRSDTAPLHGLVAAMLAACPDVHVLRDPTRGGLAASLCEIATAAHLGVECDDAAIPVPTEVAAACAFLGLDPMVIANEGRLVAFVADDATEPVLAAMHAHELGRDAVVIGRVVADHPGLVVTRTALGASRIVDVPDGALLPRIC